MLIDDLLIGFESGTFCSGILSERTFSISGTSSDTAQNNKFILHIHLSMIPQTWQNLLFVVDDVLLRIGRLRTRILVQICIFLPILICSTAFSKLPSYLKIFKNGLNFVRLTICTQILDAGWSLVNG